MFHFDFVCQPLFITGCEFLNTVLVLVHYQRLLDLETGTEPTQVSQHLVQTYAGWCGPEQLTGPE